jgi:hypothetical protein
MLSRFAIEPIPHLVARLNEVKRVKKLFDKKDERKGQNNDEANQRRSTAFRRFKMPNKLKVEKKSKSKSKLILVRKVKKRKFNDVLESSHVWSAKRMKMDRISWFGTTIATRSANRHPKAAVRLTLDSCGLHDASYEKWVELSYVNENILNRVWKLIFDPDNIPSVTDVTLQRFVIHGDSFPFKPICPVRIQYVKDVKKVRLGMHGSCLNDAKNAVRKAIVDSGGEKEISLKDLDVYTFLLIGPKNDTAFTRTLNSLTENSSTCNVNEESTDGKVWCPYAWEEMAPEKFEKYFFGQEFGNMLAYGKQSLVPVQNLTAVNRSVNSHHVRSSPILVCLDFIIGQKQRLSVSAKMILITQGEDAKRFWRIMSKYSSCCLGVTDMEKLYLTQRIPSFPRDYPDTESCCKYWLNLNDLDTQKHLKLPKSKRGSDKSPVYSPDWRLVLQDSVDSGIIVARGWHNIIDFFDIDNDLQSVPNLLVRISLISPRLSRFGARISPLATICLPLQEDYEPFAASKHWSPPKKGAERQAIGIISSAHSMANESFGIGHISMEGMQLLLRDAKRFERKKLKTDLFVLIRTDVSSVQGNFQWGVAFLTVMS